MSSPLPLPIPELVANPEIEPHLAGLRTGRLIVPVCQGCAEVVWYPRAFCARCGRADVQWQDCDGAGQIYSFSVVRQATGEFARSVPYILAYVELDVGARVLTNIIDIDVEDVRIGDRVEPVITADIERPIMRFRRVTPEEKGQPQVPDDRGSSS
jgi:hypothetical protein